jgi:hypothetical protein
MNSSRTFDSQASGHMWSSLRLCSPEPALSAANRPSADSCFVDMMGCYRCRGGLAREIEVLTHLNHYHPRCDDHSIHPTLSGRPRGLERAIRFSWGGWTWLPLFQFRMEDATLREEPARVVDALGPEYDGWDVANWFIARNLWLHDQMPIDVMDKELGLVIEAARTDRFIVAG